MRETNPLRQLVKKPTMRNSVQVNKISLTYDAGKRYTYLHCTLYENGGGGGVEPTSTDSYVALRRVRLLI